MNLEQPQAAQSGDLAHPSAQALEPLDRLAR